MNRSEFLRISASFACASCATPGLGARAETTADIEFDPAARLKLMWVHGGGRFNGTMISPAIFLYALRSFHLATLLLVCISSALALDHASAASRPAFARGPYFGQPPPGGIPEPFAPASLGAHFGFVARLAFSPDGNECFLTITDATYSHPRLLSTRQENGVWSEPVSPPFVDEQSINHEPFFSANGTRLYFTSNRDAQSASNRRDFWVVERKPAGWTDARRLPAPVNSEYTEWFFSQSANGSAWFASNRPGGHGGLDLYRTRGDAGSPAQVVNLAATINTPDDEFDPCIAPDESFLVFGATHAGGHGGADLYVSFAGGPDGWTAPVNLGDAFNTTADEYAPSLSPDGKQLFFARHNGKRCEVYWVDVASLGRFRVNGFPPVPSPAVRGPYLGQPPPARVAELFAPDSVSIPRGEGEFAERPVFSPDGRECFFDVNNYKTKTSASYSLRCEQGVWSKPEPAFFTGIGGVQTSIAADDKTIFFSGPSPADPKVRGIWTARRESDGWAEPVFLDPPVNTGAGAGFPCVVRSGALYYLVLSRSDGGLHRAQMVDGRFSNAEKLAAFQPKEGWVYGDFFVAPDESFLVIYSNLPGNLGSGDLYVSFRRTDGSWTEPRNLGAEVNTTGYDFAPSLSPDGRYLFFTRDVGGTGGVHWISLAALDAMRAGARDAQSPAPPH